MSISTLDLPLRAHEEFSLFVDSERQDAAEAEAVERVMLLVRRGDALASYEDHIINGGAGNRTLAAVISEALEWLDGTSTPELIELLVDAASGKNVEIAARDLLRSAAVQWARHTVYTTEDGE